MDVIKSLIERAQQNKQRIVLPEGTEERTLKAADKAIADGIAEVILIANREEVLAIAEKNGLTNIEKATIIDPNNNPDAEKYANLLFELRKSKGMTMEDAQKLVCNPLYLGCLIIKNGDADGQVAGALNTTGNVLRPALQIIKTTPGISCVSGAMMLITNAKEYGEDGVLFVAKENNLCNAIGNGLVGCFQCTLLGTLGENDALLVLLSAFNQVLDYIHSCICFSLKLSNLCLWSVVTQAY